LRTDLFKFWQQRSEIKLNRKVFVFIVCLVISFLSWLQINLSKVYTESVPVKIDFVNLPKTKFGTTKISDTLLVEVEADGFSLMKYEQREVAIEFRKLKRDNFSGAFYFQPNNFTKTIGKQIGENFKVIKAIVDTMQLNPTLR